MRRIVLTVLVLTLGFFLQGQNIIGKWRHYDEETGALNSIMETYMKNGKLFARIVKLYVSNQPDTLVCVDCPGDWKNQKVMGMNIVNGLLDTGSFWEGEKALLDPEARKSYDCRVWLENGKLQVRGYLGLLYQTITWFPLENESQ